MDSRFSKVTPPHRTPKEARDHREATRVAMRSGNYVPPTDETFEAFCARWLSFKATGGRKPLRPSTLASYADQLRDHVYPHIGSLPLARITAQHLDRLYVALLKDGRRNGTGGLSPRTVRYIATIVRSALQTAYRWGLVAGNVADRAEPPEGSSPEMRAWTPEQVRAFLAATKGDRFGAAYHLAAMTGMRRGEVLGLRWEDVDLEAQTLKIEQTLIVVEGSPTFSTPKTDAGKRTVALDADTVAVLRAHRAVQGRERLKAGSVWSETGLVFTREDGTPISPDYFYKAFSRRVTGLDLPYLPLHGLRHSYASALRSAGFDAKLAAAMLGHSDERITVRTYQHLGEKEAAEAAAAVAALVSG